MFEDSPLPLEKWLPVVWMITNAKNGISSWEIHRALGVTQKTAWFMLHRIRLAMQKGSLMKLGGKGGKEVEVDETFIGGKSRNMHLEARKQRITGTGGKDKAVVMGLLERGGEVRASVVPDRKRTALQTEVRKHVETGSALYSDSLPSYNGLGQAYAHKVVDHAIEYVNERVHTNGLENFWSLLKRGLNGTYISVEPFHLFRYLDEQTFRYNNRAKKDEPWTLHALSACDVYAGRKTPHLRGANRQGEARDFLSRMAGSFAGEKRARNEHPSPLFRLVYLLHEKPQFVAEFNDFLSICEDGQFFAVVVNAVRLWQPRNLFGMLSESAD